MSRFFAPLASVVFAFLAWPVHALGKAGVRFVHAVPGAGPAELTVEQGGRETRIGREGYAEHSKVRRLRAGPMRWRLSSGADTIATGRTTLSDHSYTALAVPKGTRLVVRLFRDAGLAPRGKARVRVIHASPEFGSPDLLVDGKRVVRKLGYGKATSYLTLAAGRHRLDAVRPGTKDSLLAKGVSIPGDTTTSAIVVGTRGEPARLITVLDTVSRRESGATTSTKRAKGSSGGGADSRGAEGSHVVVRGESLWSIARERLGSGASRAAVAREVKRLFDANRAAIGTGDPDLIFPGTTLRFS